MAVKRLTDIVVSLVGLVVLSPLVLIVAIAILITARPPIHFHQTRAGLHGRPFTIHKFRTMVRGAEEHLADVQHLNERNGIVFKATDDPRSPGSGVSCAPRASTSCPSCGTSSWVR